MEIGGGARNGAWGMRAGETIGPGEDLAGE